MGVDYLIQSVQQPLTVETKPNEFLNICNLIKNQRGFQEQKTIGSRKTKTVDFLLFI